jgi:hypothetical protein
MTPEGILPRLKESRLGQILVAGSLGDRAAQCLPYVLICIAVVAGFAYIHTYGVNVTWWDQWDSLIRCHEYQTGDLTMSKLWAPHDEHRIFFARLLMIGTAVLTNGNAVADMYVSEFLLFLTFLTFLAACRQQWSPRRAMWSAVPIAFLLLSLRQWQSMLWGFHVSFVMVILFVALTFLCLSRVRNERYVVALLWAGLAATLASFSSLQGIFAWPVGLGQLLLAPLTRRLKIRLAAIWGVLGVGEWAVYFYGWHHPSHKPTIGFSWEYLLTAVGNALCCRRAWALPVGAVLVLLSAAMIVVVARRRQWKEQSFWLAIMAFSAVTMTAITIGRASYGLEHAMSSRYATYPLLLVIAVFAISAAQCDGKLLLSRALWPGLMLCLIAPGIVVCSRDALAAGWTEREMKLYQQFVLCTLDSQPDEAIGFFPVHADGRRYPERSAMIRAWASFLREMKWSVFADRDLCARCQLPAPSLPVLPAGPGCRLEYVGVQPKDKTLLVYGWAVDSARNDTAGGVAVVVDDKPYLTYSGDLRVDLAKQLKNTKFVRSGFHCSIPLEKLAPGRHRVSLKVQAHDHRSVFATANTEFCLSPRDRAQARTASRDIEPNTPYASDRTVGDNRGDCNTLKPDDRRAL